MASPTRRPGRSADAAAAAAAAAPRASSPTAGGTSGSNNEWEWAVRPNKYTELTGPGGGGNPGGLETGSPVRTNVRTQGLSINLFMTNNSALADEESVDIPSSYIGDDSTVSSWPASPRVGLEQKICCSHVALKYYLTATLLLSFIFFIWSCAIGFVWGAFLGLGALGAHIYYTYVLLHLPQPSIGARDARKQRILHYATLVLSYLVLFYMLIRFCCARDTYVMDAFPTRCYGNALGTVPPACVRVTEETPPNPKAHGLIAPRIYTPKASAVVRLVEEWGHKQFQTKQVEKAGGYVHFAAVTRFLGFVDDLAVEVVCVDEADVVNGVNGTLVVRIQGEQRFGTLDGGVNKRRVASLIKYVEKKARGLPEGTCSGTPLP